MQLATGPSSNASLLRWFSITGAVSIALVTLVLGLVLTQFLTTRLIDRDAQVGREFVQGVAESQGIDQIFRAEPGPVQKEQTFIEFASRIASLSGSLRVNVYGSDRILYWSSTRDLIGKKFADNDELEAALKGKAIAQIDPGEDHHKSEHVELGHGQSRFIEYYLPITRPPGNQVIGVVEIYKETKSLWQAINDGRRLMWFCTISSGIFLYFSLVWLVKRGDRALREQRQQLLEAEGLAFVGELSAAVAHSIRNPLASIRSNAELVAELNGAETLYQLEIIQQVDRIERMLRTLLSYANGPISPGSSTHIGQILEEAMGNFQSQCASRETLIRLDRSEMLPQVAGDSELLRQVINSVITNAIEATDAGDSIELSATAEANRKSVHIVVTDTGKGIEPAQLSQVFEPFFTTKSQGLGMGLALVKRIVGRLGGSVLIEPNPGSGTRVTLTLPAA